MLKIKTKTKTTMKKMKIYSSFYDFHIDFLAITFITNLANCVRDES